MSGHFDKQLLNHIENGRNDEAKAMLTEELAKAFNHSYVNGTLLHHAAEHSNVEIARRLIALGADVDRFEDRSSTPLMTAVISPCPAVVQFLLEAGARIDLRDNTGCSALQLALDLVDLHPEILELFSRKLRALGETNDEVAEIMVRAGCTMPHAAALRDVEVMGCMLRRGVDINSRGYCDNTAIHVAVELDDVKMADWLANQGIDVDAFDELGMTALVMAVEERNVPIVRCLLEHGAGLDATDEGYGHTALLEAISCLNEGPDELVECAQLLLQHGASLVRISEHLPQMFQNTLNSSCDKASKLLIAHLAMLEMLGEPVDKSVIRSLNHRHRVKMLKLRKYYEPCQQVLAIKMFGNWSLLDLLKESDSKIRLLIRKESFLQEMEKICCLHKMSESYSYYYNTMMKRVEKAKRVVELENEAILVICKLFEANYNQFYDLARNLVEYLNVRDLQNLAQV